MDWKRNYFLIKATTLRGFLGEPRTTIVDFADAILCLDDRLAKYEPVKKGKWKTQAVHEHLKHARDHIYEAARAHIQEDADEETQLTAVALRALMALQMFKDQQQAKEARGSRPGPRALGDPNTRQ